MADINNDMYNIINDAQKQAFGVERVKVVDTTSMASLGDVVFSTANDTDAFFSKLPEILSEWRFGVKVYSPKERYLRRDAITFGAGLIKAKIKMKADAVEDPKWDSSTQASPFDVEAKSDFYVQIYGGDLAPWSWEDVIPGDQMFTCFNSDAQMAGFLSMIIANMDNKMRVASENLDSLAIATGIALTFKKGKAAQKRNLLKEYNTLTGQSLTLAQARRDMGYLTYRVQEMALVSKYMQSMTDNFNSVEGIAEFSNPGDCVFEITSVAANDIRYILRNNTYHDNFETLDMYSEINAWQALGDMSYEDVSAVKIKNEKIDADEVDVKNVIAVVRSADAAATLFNKPKTWSMYNPRADRLNYGQKGLRNYYVDASENFVVFYDDPDEA